MTKPIRKFNPSHYQDITSTLSLHIEIVKVNGECFVYGAYYDSINKCFGKVTKSSIRTNRYGRNYFVKNRQRYYLVDFLNKTPF